MGSPPWKGHSRTLGRGARASLLAALMTQGCTSLADDLTRAETSFNAARYEDVQVWLADLEPSLPKYDALDRARYYYLAGMSAHRIGQHARARHALALCREELELSQQKLKPGWMHNLQTALQDP
ncbi:MAG: hypothetical protein JWN04_3676 [Myxococcaceae bacterium]|nr:hypothetical protein [Myxococcaceae bacterium]